MRVLALLTGFGVFAADHITKWMVSNAPSLRIRPWIIIDGVFKIEYVENPGIAFGLLNSPDSYWRPFLLSAVALAALCIVLFYIARTPTGARLPFVSLGLLLGGILGNLVDRLMNQYVVDFLTLHWQKWQWPTFNVADMAITTGVALILYESFLGEQEQRVAVALLPLTLLINPAPQAEQTGELVDRLQRQYNQVEGMRADFTQVFHSRGITFREEGVLLMKKPGYMYWEYQNPTTKYFVADGNKTYFYVPQDRQVWISEMDLENTGSPLFFLLGKGDLQRDFVVFDDLDEPREGDNLVLRLTPRTPQPDYLHLFLEIVPDSLLIQRLSVVEPIGQRNDYILTNIEWNVQIPDRRFKLDYPPHVEVIQN